MPQSSTSVLLSDATARSIRYLEELPHRQVAPARAAIDRLQLLDGPLPENPSEPAEVLKLLDELGSPATMAMAGPRFFGLVMGGSLPVSIAANWLAAAWDQNTVFHKVAPATSLIQTTALRWVREILGLPIECGGAFVTGATMANFCGLAAARNAVLKKSGWDVEADGIFGAPTVSVIVGAEAHPTVTKSLGLLGLGRNRLCKVPVDNQGRIRVDRLPRISGPTIVCVQAGNVNTGAFDPINEICQLAQANGAWVHCDGAFGLWAATAPNRRHLLRGIENADSWATDAHKWLNVPYDCGAVFVRDPSRLRAAMAVSAEYLPTGSPHRNASDYTPELSQRARGVEVWAALQALGRSGVGEMIEQNCIQATLFARRLSEAGFEILNEVVLNQVLVSFGDSEITNKVIQLLQEDGTCWCGGTVWQGRTAMRISVSCWATTNADVERSAEAMIRAARKVGAFPGRPVAVA